MENETYNKYNFRFISTQWYVQLYILIIISRHSINNSIFSDFRLLIYVRIGRSFVRSSWLVTCDVSYCLLYVREYNKYLLTKPFATPVFDDPPPPATKTCRLVNISTEYSGKFTRANKPSFNLRDGPILQMRC